MSISKRINCTIYCTALYMYSTVQYTVDLTREEKRKREDELEACDDTSGESSDIKDEDDDDNNNAGTDRDSPLNQPEDVNVQTEVKFDVNEEEDDDNKVTPVPSCAQCGSKFKRKIALVKHRIEVHNKSQKICDICGKSCDSQKSLYHHNKQHKNIECDICYKKFPSNSITRHYFLVFEDFPLGTLPYSIYSCVIKSYYLYRRRWNSKCRVK